MGSGAETLGAPSDEVTGGVSSTSRVFCGGHSRDLGWPCPGTSILAVGGGLRAAGRRQEETTKAPGFRIVSFLMEYPDVGRSVVTGPFRESVRVRPGLQDACFLLLRAKACFLGGFVEDVGNRIVPPVPVPSTGADGGGIKKRSRTLAAQGHCVSWSRKWMRSW